MQNNVPLPWSGRPQPRESVVLPRLQPKRSQQFPENVKTVLRYQRDQLREAYFDALCTPRIRHLFGPRSIQSGPDDVMVNCLVKNGEFWIRAFIDHYTRLGVKHIAFIDNDSTDRTVAIASEYQNVSLYSSKMKLGLWLENAHRRFLLRKFGRDRWCINVDIDESFDYPHSDQIGLPALVRYLRAGKYTAVVGQMLDLFSKKPLSLEDAVTRVPASDAEMRAEYRRYDLTSLRTRHYLDGWTPELTFQNQVSNPDILFIRGGVRLRAFGTEVCLTKHPLIFFGDDIRAQTNSHCAARARVADFSTVLYHYKLVPTFTRQAATYVKQGYGWFSEYQAALDTLKREHRIDLSGPGTQELVSVNDLLPSRFLVASEKYQQALL